MFIIIIIIIITTTVSSSISKIFKHRKQYGMPISSTSGLRKSYDEVSAVLVLLDSQKHDGSVLGPGNGCVVRC
jgi:hypothetical protein